MSIQSDANRKSKVTTHADLPTAQTLTSAEQSRGRHEEETEPPKGYGCSVLPCGFYGRSAKNLLLVRQQNKMWGKKKK